MKLYGNYKSGNVYKVSLALHLLQKPYEEIQIGLGPGSAAESLEYLAINPLSQIPTLETDDGNLICQSNAILWYLAQGSDLLPTDAFQQSVVLQWMFFEQCELEPNLGSARWICHLKNVAQEMAHELEGYHKGGYRALGVVEARLMRSGFIASERFTIADIALYAYIHNCADGKFSLETYPGIRRWVENIQAMDHFFPMSDQFSQFDYQ